MLGAALVSALGFATPVFASHEPGHEATGVELLDDILNSLNATSTAGNSPTTGFSRDGIYGCTGATYGAVGMQGPGGAHVPVFDDAVHDQERLLTYKECLLDGIVNSMRETLISDIIKRVVTWANSGFDGNPAYVTNIPLHLIERIADPEAERIITGAETDVIAEPFRRDVRVALAKYYSASTREPESILKCNVSTEQLEAFSRGDFFGGGGWSTFLTTSLQPSCNPLYAYQNAVTRLDDAVEAEKERERTLLDWGSGFRTSEVDRSVDLGGGQSTNLRRVVTPGFMIAEHLRQTIGTGLRQSENADEIDEIISALMSHIGVELLSDVEGFSGLSRSFAGQAAYVDRLAADSAARTRGNMTGAAASIVNNTIRVEQGYAQARQGSVAVLMQARRQLETWENTCWGGVVDQARTDLAERVRSQACATQGNGNGNNGNNGDNNGNNEPPPCTVSVSVSEEYELGAIGISVPVAGSISVWGRASGGGSIVDVAAEGSGVLVGPVQPTVTTGGNWATEVLDLATIPDGSISVSATETLAGGGGTLAPVTANVQKTTTITGVELVPPAVFPALTITARAGSFTQSATIATSTARSRAIVNQSIKPILDVLRENIFRSAKALEVLAQIRDALAATSSASGQRFILERLDQLVAARVLHTEAQLRQAQDQALEIEAAMQQLLEESRDGWESGWCDPDNWEQLTI